MVESGREWWGVVSNLGEKSAHGDYGAMRCIFCMVVVVMVW